MKDTSRNVKVDGVDYRANKILIEDCPEDDIPLWNDFDYDPTEAFYDLLEEPIIHQSKTTDTSHGHSTASSCSLDPVIIIVPNLITEQTGNIIDSATSPHEIDLTQEDNDKEADNYGQMQDAPVEETVELDENCLKPGHNGKDTEPMGSFDFHITLPKAFWIEYWLGAPRLKPGWVDAFNQYFAQALPECVFKSKDNKCRTADKKHQTYFWAIGSCKNHLCTDKFIVTADQPIKAPYNDVSIVIKSYKPIKHDPDDINARFIRGPKRKELREALKRSRPHEVFLDMALKAPKKALDAGNHNDAPNLQIIQTISSENHSALNLDKDFYIHLIKLKEKYKSEWPDKISPGYIQNLGLDPFYIILYTGAQIDYLLSLRGTGYIFLYLDSTGRIVASPPGTSRRVQYYGLVLSGNGETVVLPIAEFISNCNTVYDINVFLSAVVTALKAHAVRKNILLTKIVDKIEVDWSMALINACVKAFNDTTLPLYLVWAWKFCKNQLDENVKNAFTVLHICSAHMFRAVRKNLHIFTNDADIQNVGKMVITKLIHATSLEEAALIFTSAIVVFCSATSSPDVEACLDHMKQLYTETECNGLDESPEFCLGRESESNKGGSEEEVDLEEKLRHGSPFYKFFKGIYEEVLKKCSEDPKFTKNPYYCPRFIDYILEQKMPFFALWSGILIMQFGIIRDTNATVENYFKQIKFWTFNKELRIVAPRFVRELAEKLRKLLNARYYKWVTSRQMRSRKRKAEEQEINQGKKPRSEKRDSNEELHEPDRIADSSHIKSEKGEKTAKRSAKVESNYFDLPTKIIPSSYSKQREKKIGKKPKAAVWDLEEEKWMKLPNGAYRRPRYFCLPQNASKAQAMKDQAQSRVIEKSREFVQQEPSEENGFEGETLFSRTDDVFNNSLAEQDNSGHTPPDEPTSEQDPTNLPEVADDIKLQRGSTSFDKTSALQENLLRSTLTYPLGFPDKINFKLFNTRIDIQSWKTLRFNEQLNDVIMNTALLLIEKLAYNNDFNILCLNTYMSTQILHSETGHVSKGFYNFAKKKKVWQYNVWLMPVHENWNHWTLLVINFNHKCLIYLDSLHGDISQTLVDGVCFYVQKCCEGKRIMDWSEWRVFIPRDIPHQDSLVTRNNCGVHVITHAYTIATSSYTAFHESEMKYARMGIAQMIFQFNPTDSQKISKERCIKITDEDYFDISSLPLPKIHLPTSYIPPKACDSTVKYFAFLKFNMEERHYTRRR